MIKIEKIDDDKGHNYHILTIYKSNRAYYEFLFSFGMFYVYYQRYDSHTVIKNTEDLFFSIFNFRTSSICKINLTKELLNRKEISESNALQILLLP